MTDEVFLRCPRCGRTEWVWVRMGVRLMCGMCRCYVVDAWPEPAYFFKSVDAQDCPWCGAGPFRGLADHIFQSHGIHASEMRSHYGLPAKYSFSPAKRGKKP